MAINNRVTKANRISQEQRQNFGICLGAAFFITKAKGVGKCKLN